MCAHGASPLFPTVDCVAHMEHNHSRYPQTRFLGCGVHRYVHRERCPYPPQQFLALRIFISQVHVEHGVSISDLSLEQVSKQVIQPISAH